MDTKKTLLNIKGHLDSPKVKLTTDVIAFSAFNLTSGYIATTHFANVDMSQAAAYGACSALLSLATINSLYPTKKTDNSEIQIGKDIDVK